MQKMKKHIPQKLKEGIPLTTRSGHKVRLEVTDEPLTVHTGLPLHYTTDIQEVFFFLSRRNRF
ncbi:MAG: hypothetical protein ACUBOA_08465 [Candidatus Loosdrechtia sp.]|uniref:hypothetical protein n=1 Tax=Candidatus Loosdrechtia sp. TaxID=3101272 RepID=UPI003A663B4C|nr:MAG: hypothetical protein QY305_08725 [Candidatus Jettenia sp. AMX2]